MLPTAFALIIKLLVNINGYINAFTIWFQKIQSIQEKNVCVSNFLSLSGYVLLKLPDKKAVLGELGGDCACGKSPQMLYVTLSLPLPPVLIFDFPIFLLSCFPVL